MFAHELRVRYAEVDAQGVVFNAHYLTWVDDAMSAWLEAVGFVGDSWATTGDGGGPSATAGEGADPADGEAGTTASDEVAADEIGWDLMVRHAELDWRGSAGFGDRVRIACDVRRWGTTSFDIGFVVSTGGRHLAEIVLTYVGIRRRPDGVGTAPVPARLRRLLGDPQPRPEPQQADVGGGDEPKHADDARGR